MEFSLSEKAPLPEEVAKSINFICNESPIEITPLSGATLKHVRNIAKPSAPLQRTWFANLPRQLRGNVLSLQTVSATDLLNRFEIGGELWLRHFVFRIPHNMVKSNRPARFLATCPPPRHPKSREYGPLAIPALPKGPFPQEP